MITIKLKSNNDEVYILQRLLRKAGYSINLDGDFGPKTDKIVRDFQFSHSLIADGIVGARTWSELFKRAFKSGETITGIDIYHLSPTDNESFWQEVKEKHHFCFVKASEGVTWNDPRFLQHINRLKELKILRGGYHFFRMLNEDVDGQIKNFLDSGVDFREKGMLPPVLDVEPSNDEFKKDKIKIITNNRVGVVVRMKKWLRVVEERTGKRPIIYTSRYIWDEILKAPTGFENYPLWVANYSETAQKPSLPMTWDDYAFWQYTETGVVGGIKNFDVNRLNPNISYQKLLQMAGY
jgi:GH25 family lysozyme M1 (1,4-beta-N-acetylmuramidase)